MPQVKVYNDNVHPYSELFREKQISIPPKGFIYMEAGEAQLFKGSFAPIKVDADGNPIAEGYKRIRIEEGVEVAAPAALAKFVCQADGEEFGTEAELTAYIKANHADKIAPADEEAEKEVAKRSKKRA